MVSSRHFYSSKYLSFFLFSFQRFAETRNRETPDRRIFVVDDPIPVVWNTSSWGVGVESVVVKKQPIDKLSPIEFPPFAMITDGVLSLPTSVSFKPIAPVRCGIRSNETCILSREYIVSIYIYIRCRGERKRKRKNKKARRLPKLEWELLVQILVVDNFLSNNSGDAINRCDGSEHSALLTSEQGPWVIHLLVWVGLPTDFDIANEKKKKKNWGKKEGEGKIEIKSIVVSKSSRGWS